MTNAKILTGQLVVVKFGAIDLAMLVRKHFNLANVSRQARSQTMSNPFQIRNRKGVVGRHRYLLG